MYFWGRDANPPDVQRIVPNGEMGLWFYRGNKVEYVGRGEVQSCLSGQSVSFLDISSRGEIEIVGAHFTVLGACLFFRNLNGAFGEPYLYQIHYVLLGNFLMYISIHLFRV